MNSLKSGGSSFLRIKFKYLSTLTPKFLSTVGDEQKKKSHEIKSVETQLSSSESTELEANKPSLTFAQMFRRSKFVALGDLENKILVGRIFDTVGDDLYIDYGGKFNAVCKRPERNGHLYKRNTNVEIRLINFEMATFFLSAAKHLTLLESNAKIINILQNSKDDEENERKKLFKKEVEELNQAPYY